MPHLELRSPRPAALAAILTLAAILFLGAAAASRADYPQIQLNTDGTSQLQNEEQICVNPTDPSNVVACWRDFRLGYRRVGVGYSLDGGTTWTDYLMGTVLPWQSDPVLIVHDDGTFYLVVIDYQDGGANQLLVFRSTNRGITWDAPVSAVYATGSNFEDKEWVAVDRTGGPRDGHLYIAWTRFYEVTIKLVRSTDRGTTWSAPVQVSDPGALVQWPVPIVLANGSVLVAWCDYNVPEISYDISTNGGVSWGADQTLTTTTTAPQDQINGGISVFPYPSLALDETAGPRAGWVYCVYPDRAVAGNGMDVWCRRSTNNGATWGARVRINDDPAGLNRDQFHPWVACDEQGVLTATWYDRRDDAANYLWHVYMSRSTDGGATWQTNVRITTVPSSPGDAVAGGPSVDDAAGGRAGFVAGGTADFVVRGAERGMARATNPQDLQPLEYQNLRAGLIGEYSGVAVREGVIHPIWTDTRNGNQDVFVSRIADPSGVEEEPARADWRIEAAPNPFAGQVGLRFAAVDGPSSAAGARSAAGTLGSIGIFDAAGRLVRVLGPVSAASADGLVIWDGRDEAGRRRPGGTYFARPPGATAPRAVRIVLIP